MNEDGNNGMLLSRKEHVLPAKDEDEDMETQLLGAAAPERGDGENDDRDADESSADSSAAEMSGGTSNKSSSGGYSGDYSSISEDSSSHRRAEKKKRKNNNSNNYTSHNCKGGHVEQAASKDRRGGGDGDSRIRVEDARVKAKADIGGGAPPCPSGDAIVDDRGIQLRKRPDLNDNAVGRRHAAGANQSHEELPPKDQHIHSYHHHNHGHHHHHHHHHHPPRGGTNKAQQDDKVNQKIDEIMNLYSASLQAVANEYSKEHRVREKQGEEDAATSFRVEAAATTQSRHGHHPNSPPQLGSDILMQGKLLGPTIKEWNLYQTRVESNFPSNSSNLREANVVVTSSKFPEAPAGNNIGVIAQAQSECYANLMEACRPFFRDGHTLVASGKPSIMLPANATASQNHTGSESSGFTSFFTTTKSESNQTHSGSGGSFSERSQHNKEQSSVRREVGDAGQGKVAPRAASSPMEGAKERNQANPYDLNSDIDWSDSSMAVLATVKRKHKSSSNSDNTNGSRKRSGDDHLAEGAPKRVRIDTVALNDTRRHHPKADNVMSQDAAPTKKGEIQQHQRAESSSFTMSSLSHSSGSDSGGQPKQKEEDSCNVQGGNDVGREKLTETAAAANQPPSKQLRIVTSSSSGTNTANTGSSGSGTGSSNENNTTSKSESGGSGDYENNYDEQKVSGTQDSTGGSFGCEAGSRVAPLTETIEPEGGALPAMAHSKTDKQLIRHHQHGAHHEPQGENKKAPPDKESNTYPAVAAESTHQEDTTEAMASKEKIMEKKRKRMNMRREYEEEVHRQMRDSSASSSVEETTNALEPGKPVTLEDVLSFTKTARLLVQALPPFLAVHVNASFTSLCGVESSTAIGMPVASIISLPDATSVNKESDSSGSKDAMSSLSGSADDVNRQINSDMTTANDAAMQRGAEAAAQQHGAQNDHHRIHAEASMRIDRLIVARGYGHIHNVDVLFLPHHSHARAIEGSEVKFVEGNNGPSASGKKCRKKGGSSRISCRMSVSPVISTAPSPPPPMADVGNHRCSQHHPSYHPLHNPSRPPNSKRWSAKTAMVPSEMRSVKHYLIQLEASNGPRLLVSRTSYTLSSTDTTVAAQILGITKTEVQARRCRLERRPAAVQDRIIEATAAAAQQGSDRADRRELEDSQDENASEMEPVATCG